MADQFGSQPLFGRMEVREIAHSTSRIGELYLSKILTDDLILQAMV
ncbi:MAG TPA: hypothetical protein PLG59_04175 [bacterium]|nr:hypothetical protein [bacterium]